MTIGVPIEGTSISIFVAPNSGTEAAPVEGVYVEVGNLTSIAKNGSRNKTSQTVFNRATAYVTYDQSVVTYTLQGLKSVGDGGQDELDTLFGSNATGFLKILWDGANGFTVPIKVGTKTGNGTPADRTQASWELSGQDDETLVGTGPGF